MLELKLVKRQDIRALQYIRYLDDTFRDKAFCHMIIVTIQAATILALCVGPCEREFYKSQ